MGCYLGSIRVLGDEENAARVEMASYGMSQKCSIELEMQQVSSKGGASLASGCATSETPGPTPSAATTAPCRPGGSRLTMKVAYVYFEDFDRDSPRRLSRGMTIRSLSPVSRSWPPAPNLASPKGFPRSANGQNKGLHRGNRLQLGRARRGDQRTRRLPTCGSSAPPPRGLLRDRCQYLQNEAA